MTELARPHALALIAALHAGVRSACGKSRRGVAAFNGGHRFDITGPHAAEGYVYSWAHNRLVFGECDGSPACKRSCSQRCIHAEAAAIMLLPSSAREVDLVHVKVRPQAPADWTCYAGAAANIDELDALIDPSGPPSCMQCAVLIAANSRVAGIWLYHRQGVRIAMPAKLSEPVPDHPGCPAGWLEISAGWRRWPSGDFLRETMAQCSVHPRTPTRRGTPDWPCESCGSVDSGATSDDGWCRCNACGYPAP